ncbi:MAG: Clp protease N-terminal domain-containing protein [Planctomycetota bacterium]
MAHTGRFDHVGGYDDVWELDVWELDVWELDVWELEGMARAAQGACPSEASVRPMSDRLDHDTRLVLERARDAAAGWGETAVASEHLLLGLLADPALVDLFFRLGVTRADVHRAIGLRVHPAALPAIDRDLPLGMDATDALRAALEEADGFGHATIRTGHLLLGLVRESEGVAGRVLEAFGATVDGLRHEVLEYWAETEQDESGEAGDAGEAGAA